MNFLRTEQTGKIPKVVIQGGGIRCENMPPLISSYIEKDLTFNTPGYNQAIQSGRYINPDSNPTFTLFLKEKEKYWIPRGYVFFLLRNLRKSKYKVEIVDKTLTFKIKDKFSFLGVLRDYQEKAKKDIIRYPIGILHANTGCLSGDTIVRLNRGGKGFSISLENLYKRFHKIGKNMGKNWNLNIPTKIRSYNHHENKVLLNTMEDVVDSGIKEVYLFTLEDGKKIKTTLDHKVLTDKGWKKFKNIKQNDLIMVDTPKAQKNFLTENKRIQDVSIWKLKHHPLLTNKHKKRVKHILIFEAYLNKLSLKDFIYILKNDKDKAKNLKYIDTKKHSVHHMDEDHFNNKIDNLQLMLRNEHFKHHAQKTKNNFGQGKIQYIKVKSKKYIGKIQTYDICCSDPYNNFTANDIVVHNSGKTIIACSVIAHRQQPTLIIVHSKELLYQWQDRIKDFLGVQCGLIGDGNYSIAPITVGIINSVIIHVKKLTKIFGQVICDEVHRVGGTNYVYTLQEFHAKYFLGLTATPYRSDGLSGIIYAAVGPKIHTIKIDDGGFVLKPDVYRIQTNFKYLYVGDHSDMLNAMMENGERNRLICSDITSDLRKYNENILVISDRKKHLDNLSKILLSEYNLKNTILTGSTKGKVRTETIKNVREGKVKILLATTPLIMEGFDVPNLTALFMATPLRFKGRVIQACGRILRPSKDSPNKIPRIYDYRDNWINNLRNAGLKRDRMYMVEWGKKTK